MGDSFSCNLATLEHRKFFVEFCQIFVLSKIWYKKVQNIRFKRSNLKYFFTSWDWTVSMGFEIRRMLSDEERPSAFVFRSLPPHDKDSKNDS